MAINHNKVSVLFVREGSSDDGLKDLFSALFDQCGVEANIVSFAFNKRRKALNLALADAASNFGDSQIVLVHRDADNAGPEARLQEIETAAKSLSPAQTAVPVIPVKETEAWVLHAMHDDNYCVSIGVNKDDFAQLLPKKKDIEKVNAKDRLEQIHTLVFEKRGKRRSHRKPSFSESRSRWIGYINEPSLLECNASFEKVSKLVHEAVALL